jgi:hypothetical protein
MLTTLRKRMTYANVVMTLALVFAMTGGAYAAKKYLITSTKQISPSVLKSLVGKAGPAGTQGPAGPQGVAGSSGAKGETGAAGKEGAQGKEGPVGATGPGGTTGAKGATGPAGPKGVTGEPWTAGGTLPSGSTETGSWWMPAGSAPQYASISFPVPLAADIEESHAKFIPVGGTVPTECENSGHAGTASPLNPEASKGYFCVYAGAGTIEEPAAFLFHKAGTEAFTGPDTGASTAGSIVFAGATVTGGPIGYFGGTWAVTAQ